MRERDEPIGAAPGADREDGIPVLTEVEERRAGDAPARVEAPPRVDARPTDAEPTARIDVTEDRIAALIAELATLRAATERMSARLAALEGHAIAEAPIHEPTIEERPLPVLVTAVWMLERTDSGEPSSVVLGAWTRIGRAADCDIVVDGAAVSRHHALIHLDRDGAVLEDLNSTNGTFLNGRRVLRAALRDGDVVTLGEARFKVTGPDGGPSAP